MNMFVVWLSDPPFAVVLSGRGVVNAQLAHLGIDEMMRVEPPITVARPVGQCS